MSAQITALPPVVDHQTWRAALDELRKRPPTRVGSTPPLWPRLTDPAKNEDNP
jgi:hypothetical protein